MVNGMDLFKQEFLDDPRQLKGVPAVSRSTRAVVSCGGVKRGDIVWLKDVRCGRVNKFYDVVG